MRRRGGARALRNSGAGRLRFRRLGSTSTSAFHRGVDAGVDGDVDGTSTAGGDNAVVAEAQKALDAASGPTGTFKEPPTGATNPPKGKDIVVIPFGQGIPSFAAAVKEVQAAGDKLGWNVRVVDGKFSPNAWLAGIRDAINAKADGIITFGPDCPPIKAALQDAKKANIPVINVEGHDCDTLNRALSRSSPTPSATRRARCRTG